MKKGEEYKKALAADLRKVYASEGLEIDYQPQMDLKTRRVTRFEALLRWRHPLYGDVSPSDFIALAEDIGLIDEIGEWVLLRACHEAATWPREVGVVVNVSPLQLRDAGLPAKVSAALQASGLAASRLELEITETSALPDTRETLACLEAIRRAGVGIVMDDFDVGHSALGHLIDFPITKAKIDQSLVRRLSSCEPRHDVAAQVVRSVIGLCGSLNIGCCAEGVETEEQMAILEAAGGAEIQGYLVGPPGPAAGVHQVLLDVPERMRRTDPKDRPSPRPALAALQTIPFFQIAESANDVIIVTTPQLSFPGPEILYVNPAFTRLTGYTLEEAVGRSPRMLQGPGASRKTLDAIRSALEAGRPVHEKVLNFAKSGAPYWLDLQISPLRDARGAITHFAAIERDVTMDKRRLDELEYMADRDTLTGISNRRAFLRAVQAECDAARAAGGFAAGVRGPCVAFIDVDHFKRVNDELGHAIGDAVLCGVADRLAENVRRLDILGRIGGEEFAVCMPGVTLKDAKALAERLRCAIFAMGMATPVGPVDITVSIGVACYGEGDTVASVTDRADAAMYDAKRAGRNRVMARAKSPRGAVTAGP
jgi:diguanylate cyclase (GGDEF)-like protein/PAS domain S-box-containing protein